MRLILANIIFATVLIRGKARQFNFIENYDKPSRIARSGTTADLNIPYGERWFSQQLDHFNPADQRVWQQRFFINNSFYKSNAPVFLSIGGESPSSGQWVRKGQMADEAKRFGALMFLLEHRFYGMSQPAANLSVENLAYLNAEQALLDLAFFIEGMNKAHNIPKETKWIVFGCSYAGSLAAWMRAKYPHLVHGAVSSSGPLLAKVDFQELMVVVEESLKTHSQACVDVISSATNELGKMVKSTVDQKNLKELFKLCDPIDSGNTTAKDIANLHQMIADSFAYVVQINKNNRLSQNITIDKVCDVLVDEKLGAPIDRLAKVSNMILKYNKEKCLDYKYSKLIEKLSNVTLTEENVVGKRQWMYQSCTEFGFFQSSTLRPNLFGDHFPVDFFLQQCADIFGPQFARSAYPGADRTNTIFGGLDLVNSVSNVVFVHGSIDPWHPLGITKSSNPKAPAIFINGTTHCTNIYLANENDLPELVEARNQVHQLIGQWLEDKLFF